jgi:hypothetical protein
MLNQIKISDYPKSPNENAATAKLMSLDPRFRGNDK